MTDTSHDIDDEYHRQSFAVNEAFGKLSHSWLNSIAKTVPPLYHYTDSASFLGILAIIYLT